MYVFLDWNVPCWGHQLCVRACVRARVRARVRVRRHIAKLRQE